MYYSSAEEEQFELDNKPTLKLITNTKISLKKDYYLYYNSGIFPVLMVIIFFLCIGVIINIGLRIQNLNYDKKIYSINKLIDAEKERKDRLNLKISELKSPSRIAGNIFMLDNLQSNANENKNIDNNKINQVKDDKSINNSQDQMNNEKSINHVNLKNIDIFYSETANEMTIANQNNDFYNDSLNFKGVNLFAIINNIKNVLMVVSEGILTFFIP